LNKFINKSLLAYGASLAILAWILQFMQYKYHVRLLSVEWYTVIVAISRRTQAVRKAKQLGLIP